MGKGASKSSNEGDANVQITNLLENHQQFHEENALKLWLILVMVGIQTVIMVYNIIKKNTRKNALKAAKSIAVLEKVWVRNQVQWIKINILNHSIKINWTIVTRSSKVNKIIFKLCGKSESRDTRKSRGAVNWKRKLIIHGRTGNLEPPQQRANRQHGAAPTKMRTYS